MTTMTARMRTWLPAAVIAALLVIALWSIGQSVSASTAADDARQQLDTCRRLVQEIRATRGQAELALVAPLSSVELQESVDTARRLAELPDDAVALLETGPSARIGSSEFKRQETQVQLQPMNLSRLARFVEILEEMPARLVVSSIVLSHPGSGRSGTPVDEQWRIEIALTQTVYDPITRP